MTDTSQNQFWYVRSAGQVRGPFPPGQIAREILLGRISGEDELSRDREQWRPFGDLPELMPPALRAADTPDGQQRFMLARLREDERLHDRRRSRAAADDSNRRRRDRRNVESFENVAHHDLRVRWEAEEGAEERNLLVPAAALLTLVFVLLLYFIWYRPATPVVTRDCRAAPAPAVDWNGCSLPGSALERADLREANLGGAILTRADLRAANLLRADLSHANLEGAELRSATLREAKLTGAVLRGANLGQADLRDADLDYAVLDGANLTGANLTGAKLGRAVWNNGRVCAPDSIGTCR